jgi:arylsulfatase
VVILLDDAGFGSTSAFGGPCDTPTFEKLAAGGLRYTRFHSTARRLGPMDKAPVVTKG